MISNTLAWIDSWIFESFSRRPLDLGIYRIIYSAFLLLTGPPVAPWLANAPRAFFSPPVSLAVIFSNFPSYFVALLMNVILAAFLALLLAGWHTRLASLGTGMTLIVIKSFEYSIGKVNHDILIVIPPLVLAFSNWGETLSFDSRRHALKPAEGPVGNWCLAFLAMLIGVAMFTAGWAKLASGWLNPDSPSTYGHLLINYFVTGRESLGAKIAVTWGPSMYWKIADWLVTFLELGFIVAMLNQRAWYVFIAAGCLFHLGTWILFDIVFDTNVIAYGAFLQYHLIVRFPLRGNHWDDIFQRLRRAFPPVVYPIAAFIAALFAISQGRPLAELLHFPMSEVIVALGSMIALTYLTSLACSALRRIRSRSIAAMPHVW